jgi:phosphate transport system protein
MHDSLFREMLTYMMEDPRNITPCTHLLFAARNIERMGDLATNIAEVIHFQVTGDTLGGDRPKVDDASVTIVETR